nr:unnamed protein product [Callosobruchus analis]
MEVLVRQRGGLKASLTNFSKYLTQVQAIEELSGDQVIEFESRLNNLENIVLQRFYDIQDKIETSCDENDLEDEYSERFDFENKYYCIIALAKATLNKYKEAESFEKKSNVSASSVVSDGQATGDIYESLIHKNELISEVQRFHYLRSSLTGEPAQLIKGVEFSSDNYSIAWDMLVQRYNNDDMLVHNYVKNLFHMEPILKESSKSIRNMLDSLSKNLRALNQLQLPTEHWDVLIVFLMASKLDLVTEREWVTFKSKRQGFPKIDDFIKFLNYRLSILETIEQSRCEKATESRGFKKRHEVRSFAVTDGSEKVQNCTLCSGQHFIQTCPEFLKIPVSKRSEKIISLRLCLNCLRSGHMGRACRRAVCKKCHSKHHHLLHVDKEKSQDSDVSGNSNEAEKGEVVAERKVSTIHSARNDISSVFLATAHVEVYDKDKNKHTLRALLDNGAESSFITEEACNRLQIQRDKANLFVNGINNAQSCISSKCEVQIHSASSGFSINIVCFVLPKITGTLPKYKMDISRLNIPNGLQLADPWFAEPQNIDILIGSDCFWNVMCRDQIPLGRNLPVLQNTKFGWIVSGPLGNAKNRYINCNFTQTIDSDPSHFEIQQDLRRFWELEEFAHERPKMSDEETACENHFKRNTRRAENGAFIVKLPLKQYIEKLGETYEQAKRRFLNLEKRLNAKPEFNNDEHMNAYELNTVTYGMAAASFLAIRCIFQLADENQGIYPDIARIMKSDFYVDDLLTGADTVEGATRISEVIFKILKQGCFKLRKFHSNEPKVLDWLETDNDNLSKMVDLGEREQTKTLGLMWCPKSDSLMYRVKELDSCDKVTKRTILSGSSKIFDPLGLVAPCVMQIKILLQSLWLENISWDDALPGHIVDRWNAFKAEVNALNELVIDRHAFCRGMTTYEIHTFCDASEKAYGGCVYVKSFDENNGNRVQLLTAKGKVAPLKTVTLPRLELCGALLAARLAQKVSTALRCKNIKKIFWTDSTIVLGWIKTPPRKLKTFVGNRVSEIQDLAGTDEWRHVPTDSNPADLLSRGLKADEIRKADIWWHGPKWLSGDEGHWPKKLSLDKNSLPDIRNTNVLVVRQNEKCDLFNRYSDLTKLIRIVALLYRFIQNCKANKIDRKMNPLTVLEINYSCNKLQLKQHIWSRWNKEYVTELQQRCKWKSTQGELKEGDMVIIKEDNLPPLKWKLGRVTSLHSGSDGVNRVATVKTQNGFVKRAFAKLCPLPVN